MQGLPSMEDQAPGGMRAGMEHLAQMQFPAAVAADMPSDEPSPVWPTVVVGGAFIATALWAGLLAWLAARAIIDWG